jgi:hypothetical protein
MSLVLYLEDAGETVFWEAPVTAPSSTAGFTLNEELDLSGISLSTRRTYRIPGKRGRCLLFPHDLLHAGAPLDVNSPFK